MKKRNIFSVIVFVVLLKGVSLAQEHKGQDRVKLVAEIPITFGVGYEHHFNRHWSASVQAGALTSPNSDLILFTLEAFGTSEDVVFMIKDAFQFGLTGKGGLGYNFGKNYTGAFVQWIGLNGKDTPTQLVEAALDVSISSYPQRPNKPATTPTTLTLKSNLIQGGVFFGRRININSKSELNLELAISANLTSKSSLYSDSRDLRRLSAYTDTYLADLYKTYAFIPSVTVAYAWRFSN